eukprot:CFRG2710T1
MVLYVVVRCGKKSCSAFQVKQETKSTNWKCKLCGEKQSLKMVYFTGSGKDCRVSSQTLNMQRGMKDELRNDAAFFSPYEETTTGNDSNPAVSKWSHYIEEDSESEENDSSCINEVLSGDGNRYTTVRLDTERNKRSRENIRIPRNSRINNDVAQIYNRKRGRGSSTETDRVDKTEFGRIARNVHDQNHTAHDIATVITSTAHSRTNCSLSESASKYDGCDETNFGTVAKSAMVNARLQPIGSQKNQSCDALDGWDEHNDTGEINISKSLHGTDLPRATNKGNDTSANQRVLCTESVHTTKEVKKSKWSRFCRNVDRDYDDCDVVEESDNSFLIASDITDSCKVATL